MDLLVAATAHAHAATPYTRRTEGLRGLEDPIEIISVRATAAGGAARCGAREGASGATARPPRQPEWRLGRCHAWPVATPFMQHSDGAVAVLSIGAIAFSVGELWQAFRLRRGAAPASIVGEVLFRLLFVGAILLLPLGASVVPRAEVPGGVVAFVVGATVGWSGLLLRWWSFVALGRYFTVVVGTSSGQKVVDRGPYRLLRHPSYTG